LLPSEAKELGRFWEAPLQILPSGNEHTLASYPTEDSMKKVFGLVAALVVAILALTSAQMMHSAEVRYTMLSGSDGAITGTATIVTWDSGEHEVFLRVSSQVRVSMPTIFTLTKQATQTALHKTATKLWV
jgi:hypothetical protein